MAQLRKNRYASFYDASMDDETLDNELATATSDGLMSKEDKIKLDRISDGATGGPVNVENIIVNDQKQFVSKEQINRWEAAAEDHEEINADEIIETEQKQFVSVQQINKWEAASGPIDAEDIIESDKKQFVSAAQVKKWEEACEGAEYDEETETLII